MNGFFQVGIEIPLDDYDCNLSEEDFINTIEEMILDTLGATSVEIYDYAVIMPSRYDVFD